ncbi:hypothetical protein [Pseudonocardia charpentierae]|uniref:Macro domain-containing protein n=1 Tax=Pseudonocardia charpentierae TaxID=3075545 RepID=A0ABU2NLF7_9PSEU|nr:hypothetical protein [Pseudonocardia sp. DSM 45834]MDT0354074.1 hypothetical protein [Pseudonocardia sp. DSM 45834]
MQAAAVEAVERRGHSAGDWTEAFARNGSVSTRPASARLKGTVAVVQSRNEQVGDRNCQINRIVHTVSPTVAAAALLDNPNVVDGLIDVA